MKEMLKRFMAVNAKLDEASKNADKKLYLRQKP